MAPDIEHGVSLLLASGSLVVASGVFVLLRSAGIRGLLAGLLLASGGAGMVAITLARYVVGTRTGDMMSFFFILAAAAAGLLCFALRFPDRSGKDGRSVGPGPEGGE